MLGQASVGAHYHPSCTTCWSVAATGQPPPQYSVITHSRCMQKVSVIYSLSGKACFEQYMTLNHYSVPSHQWREAGSVLLPLCCFYFLTISLKSNTRCVDQRNTWKHLEWCQVKFILFSWFLMFLLPFPSLPCWQTLETLDQFILIVSFPN